MRWQWKIEYYVIYSTNATETNLMATCARYGILYGYFLAVCEHYVYRKCHYDMQMPKNCRNMYKYLDDQLSSLYKASYVDITESKGYPQYVKESLLPENKIIDMDRLDVTMYFRIMELFGEEL